jgi:hypothetical protein
VPKGFAETTMGEKWAVSWSRPRAGKLGVPGGEEQNLTNAAETILYYPDEMRVIQLLSRQNCFILTEAIEW